MDKYAQWDHLFEVGEGAPVYLGLSRTEAKRQATARGIMLVRVADLDAERKVVLTFDVRRDRLTLLVHRGQVMRSVFF